jgi:hypothetical protein
LEKSFKFKYIEENLLKLLRILQQNKNFKKYIKYLVDNPLSQSDVTEDLIQTGNIVLTPFDTKILNQQKALLFINPLEGNLKNQPLSNITFLVDIIVPNSKWLLNSLGQIRVFRIADEIAQDVDQKKVMGIGECEVTKFKVFKVNDDYSGLSLWLNVSSSTLKGLR